MKSGKLSGTLAKRSDADKKLNRGGRHGITEIIYKALIELRACSVAELAQFIWDSDDSSLLSNFKSLEVFNRFVDKARVFVGKADGVDRALDGTVWGDSTYANDHLVMKWSKAWDDARFYGAPWTPDAWLDNEWNGAVPEVQEKFGTTR
jgi:hypothetical protein